MKDRKEYAKAYNQAHKEQDKAYKKAYYQAHKQEHKAYMKAWHASHKDQAKAYMKVWRESNKEHYKEYQKEYQKAYSKSDVNALGQTKGSIRQKSKRILKQMNLHIDGYEIHHCFGYEDPSKFIYISKALHRRIHKFLRDNNISANNDHWMAIRDLVNSTDELTYIKC